MCVVEQESEQQAADRKMLYDNLQYRWTWTSQSINSYYLRVLVRFAGVSGAESLVFHAVRRVAVNNNNNNNEVYLYSTF